jgi:hypothetical protein
MRVPCGAGGSRRGVRVDENKNTRFILGNRLSDTIFRSEGCSFFLAHIVRYEVKHQVRSDFTFNFS